MLVAMIGGTALGVFGSLVPGLHMALALALLLAAGLPHWIGHGPAAAFIAAAAGANLYARCLAVTYHPSASADNAASLDPALRLTSNGRGPDALRLMLKGTDLAWIPVVGFAILLGVMAVFGINGARELDKAIGWAGIPVILLWIGVTVVRSKNKLSTAFGFAAMGLFGYTCLHHPALKGNEHAMAPLMAGLFGIPIMIGVLAERVSGLGPQRKSRQILLNPRMAAMGSVMGCATGFLAGLGAGSLVSFLGSQADGDEDYLLLTSSGEAANNIMALLLVLVAGMGRSGEAVLLGRVSHDADVGQALILLGIVAVAAVVGRGAALTFESGYIKGVGLVSPKLWGLLVIGLALFQVVLTGQLWLACVLTFSGTCLSLWCRESKLPLQVSFGAIAIPLLIQSAGLAPAFNGWLYG